jgi:hypothetical protein
MNLLLNLQYRGQCGDRTPAALGSGICCGGTVRRLHPDQPGAGSNADDGLRLIVIDIGLMRLLIV